MYFISWQKRNNNDKTLKKNIKKWCFGRTWTEDVLKHCMITSVNFWAFISLSLIMTHFQGSRRVFNKKKRKNQKTPAFSCFECEAKQKLQHFLVLNVRQNKNSSIFLFWMWGETERHFLYVFITVADVGKTPQLQLTPQGIVTSALLQLIPQPSNIREGWYMGGSGSGDGSGATCLPTLVCMSQV